MATLIMAIVMVIIGTVVCGVLHIVDRIRMDRHIAREASASPQWYVLLNCGDYIQLPLSSRPMEGMIYPCSRCRVRSSLDFTPWVEASKHITMLDRDMVVEDDLR